MSDIPIVSDVMEDSLKSVIGPHALIYIDKFKQKLSDNKYQITISIINDGHAICEFVSMRISSRDKAFFDATTAGTMKITRGDSKGVSHSNFVDVVAKNVAPLEVGSITFIFKHETDVDYEIIKTDSRSEWRKAPSHKERADVTITAGQLMDIKTGKPVEPSK